MGKHVITKLTPQDNYRLMLEFDGSERRIFDVAPYIKGELYGELADVSYFKQVRIGTGGTFVMWPHEQDISPEDLYELSVAI